MIPSHLLRGIGKPILIGFAGKSGSGKDTLAGELTLGDIEDKIVQLGFADAVKWETGDETVCLPKAEKRAVWQRHGTLRRKKHPFYWIEELDYELNLQKPEIALITDVRFNNEVNYIQNNGGLIFYLKGSFKPLPVELAYHESEQLNIRSSFHLIEHEWTAEQRVAFVKKVSEEKFYGPIF